MKKRKLQLRRETIANLSDLDLQGVVGGAWTSECVIVGATVGATKCYCPVSDNCVTNFCPGLPHPESRGCRGEPR
jgi:hypothetical protein